ncbi:MAG: hypothetical protein RI959_503 [Pseudomonadota bacterium]|jgi:hypothetical protein
MTHQTPANWRSRCAALAVSVLTLAGCATQQVTDYAQAEPKLDLAQYFNGRVEAHGMFQDRGGQVVKRFTVQMDCSWSGDQGVLDERFTYADGSQDRRVWRLTRLPNGRYTGTADDVVGQAEGQVSGNAFRWAYTLNLPVDGKVYEVQFDDWMYLINDRVMLNRATMSKFGIRLGEVTLSFYKPGAQ